MQDTILKPIIHDVLFTESDETYYVLNHVSDYQDLYSAKNMDDLEKILLNDGWEKCCGGVIRWDEVNVDMWCRGKEYIAFWLEAIY